MADPEVNRSKTKWRWRRWISLIIASLMVLVLTAALTTQTAWFREHLRQFVQDSLNRTLAGEVSVRKLEGNLYGVVIIHDVELMLEDAALLRAKRLSAEYSLVPLIVQRRLVLDYVALEGVEVHLLEDERGWNVSRVAHPRTEGPSDSSSLPIELRNIEVIDAAIDVTRPGKRYTLRQVNGQATAAISSDKTLVALKNLSFRENELGIELRTLTGELERGSNGDVVARQVVLKTGESSLRADGRLSGEEWQVEADIDNLSAAELQRISGGGQPRVDLGGAVRIHGPLRALALDGTVVKTLAGSIELGGSIDVIDEEHAYDLRAKFDHLDARALVGPETAATDLNGSLRAKGKGVTLESATTVAQLAIAESSVAGSRLTRLSSDIALDDSRLAVAAQLEEGSGRAFLDARLHLGNQTYDGTLRVEQLDPGPLLQRPDLALRLNGHLTVAGTGYDPKTARGEAALEMERSQLDAIQLNRLKGRFRVANSRLSIDELVVDSPVARGHAAGSLDLGDILDRNVDRAAGELEFDLSVDDLKPIARLAKVEGLSGGVTLEGTAGGRLAAINAKVRASGHTIAVNGFQLTGLEADVVGQALGSDRASIDVRAKARQLVAGGKHFQSGDIEGNWRMTSAKKSSAHAVISLAQDQTHSHHVDATVDLEGDQAALTLGEARFDLGKQRWSTIGVAHMTRRGDRFNIADLQLRSGEKSIAVAGDLGLVGKQDLRVVARGIALDTLTLDSRVTGMLSADVHLRGSAESPELEVESAIERPAFDKVVYERAQANLRVAGGQANLSASLVQSGESIPGTAAAGQAIQIEAMVPVVLSLRPMRYRLNQPLTGAVRANDIDVAFLDPLLTQVSRLGGRLNADLSLSGDPLQPQVSGSVALVGGRARIVPTGVTYDPIEAQLRLDGRVLQIDSLKLISGDGSLTGDGRVELAATGVAGGAAFQLKEFPLFGNRFGEGNASGILRISGSADAPLVEGKLETNRLIFRIPEQLPGAARKPDPTIRIVGPAAAAVEQPVAPLPQEELAEEAPPSLYERADIHVEIKVPRDAWLRRSDAEIELRGNIVASKKPGEALSLAGRIDAVRGWYSFQGRKFTVEEGEVTLTGQGFDPILRVVAVHEAGDYTVRARIGGNLTKPSIKLESEPALDQADILSVLLFGKPASQLNQSEASGLRTQAVGVAGSYIAGEFRRSVADALGLDTLEVEPSTEGIGKTSASIGKYVTEDIFVSLSHKFAKEGVQQITIQYFLSRRWTIETSTDTLGNSGIDLFWKQRY